MNIAVEAVLIAAMAVALAGCNKQTAAPEEKKAADVKGEKDELVLNASEQTTAGISLEAVRISKEPDMLHVKGRIALDDNRSWRVGIRTPGLVMAVYAGLGDYVEKGKVLARYHADEVRDTRAQYRAAVSELERAKTQLAQAGRTHERAQRLLDLKAGSVAQVEQTQQDISTAEAAVRKAEVEIDRAKDVLEDDLKVPAEPKKDDPLADEVPIIAPASGYVIQRNLTLGKAIDLTTDTFVIGDLSQVWMLASVSPEDLGRLRAGQSAMVWIGGDGGPKYRGGVTNLGQRFDPETRMMEVRIELKNPANRLRPEMLASADLPVGGTNAALTVPADAIQQVNGQDVVFVRIAPDRFKVRPVRAGATDGGRTTVYEGLKDGEEIVVRGTFTLKSHLLKSTLEGE